MNGINKIWETYLNAKPARIPFKNVRDRANERLQLIHADVCGTIDPITWVRKRYFLNFLDDYTNFAVVFSMKHMSEVPSLMKGYIAYIE